MKRKSSRSRSNLLKRKTKNRNPLARIVIYCEGEVTEYCYFEALRVLYRIQPVHLKTVGMGSGPKQVAERAVRHCQANRRDLNKNKANFTDQVWVVFDRDEHQDYKSTIRRCEDVGIQAAYSNPCFELWLILHDCDMDQPLTRHEAQRICRERGLFSQGSEKKPSPQLVDNKRVLLAEQRAVQQLRKRLEEDLQYGPPSTNVGSLTKMLRSNGRATL